MSKPDLHSQRKRRSACWRDFWERKPVSRPLFGTALEILSAAVAVCGKEGVILPTHLDMRAYLDTCDSVAAEARTINSDSVWAASAFQGLPWMEAILGCSVHYAGGTFWAEPPSTPIEEIIADWRSSPWLTSLIEMTKTLATHADGQYPVSTPVLRGPADIVAALRSSSVFCMDCYDAPEQLQLWLAECANAYREVVRALIAVLSHHSQGNVQASRQVWAPDLCFETQEDAAALISPAHYRKFILPRDRELWELAPYTFHHLHSTALHYLTDLLSESRLRAIEITLDEGGPPLSTIMDKVRQVQAAGRPVILHGALTAEDMAMLARSLPSAGLYIAARVNTAGEANDVMSAVTKELDRER